MAPDGLAQAPEARRSEASCQPRKLSLRSPMAHRRPTGLRQYESKRFAIAPTRTALRHYVGPFELSPIRRRPPFSYVPWLHGRYPLPSYYGRSDPDRPFRRRPSWFPDSRLSDCRPCCLQLPLVLPQPRSTPSALGTLFCSGFALALASSPTPTAESSSLSGSSTAKALRPGRSLPVALHPGVSPRCKLRSDTGPTVSARSGTFTLLSKSALRRTSAEHGSAATLAAAATCGIAPERVQNLCDRRARPNRKLSDVRVTLAY